MAKKPPKTGFATNKVKSQTYTTKWLKNAMKSVGLASNEVIKEISPNLYEVTQSGVDTSRSIVQRLRKNTSGTNKVTDSLKNNKFVKFANTAYKNAMADFKSGNLYNDERMNSAIQGSMFGDLEEAVDGISFGDDGADSNVNVNIVNTAGGNDSAVLKLSDQISKQAIGQAKMQKASMDAYIATSAAGMQQIGQIGAEIVNQLTNVNSNLMALVQYQNDNMTKFIEASLAFYDRTGSRYEESTPSEKITAGEVLNSNTGGIKMSQYKSYVKQQFKDMAKNSNAGLIKSLLDDDTILEMAASNPVGFLTKGLTSYMMPKVLKTSLETMETTFSNFMPSLLAEVAEMAEDTTQGFKGAIKRTIGKTFGLKNKKITRFDDIKIERGAIPFDGETKHAITEIITKELRDQTGYLKIIASHYKKDSETIIANNRDYWSWRSNGYVKEDQLNKDIAQEIVDSVTNSFKETKFGDILLGVTNRYRDEKDRKEMEYSVNELFMDIVKSGKKLSLEELVKLVESGGAGKNTKKAIIEYLKLMAKEDKNAFQNLDAARIYSEDAMKAAYDRINNDGASYHIDKTKFAGGADIQETIAEIMGYGKNSKKRRETHRLKRKDLKLSSINGSDIDEGDLNGAVNIRGKLGRITNSAVGMMQTIMSGDTKGFIDKGVSFISDHISKLGNKISSTLFGEKDDEGYKRDGIFSNVSNGFSDLINQMKWHITGKGYKDSKGNTIESKEDSVLGNFRKIGNIVKDGVMLKLFGKEKDEDGNYIKSKEGIFGKIVNTFKTGFDGWTDAFFGTDGEEDPEKAREQTKGKIIDYIKEAMPNTITGSAIGVGVGMATGGSLLGLLVGGPLGGAAMGAATGFLTKNEKFQTWLFGKKDEESGERTGGLISQKVQKFFKENKTFMAGSAAIGVASGVIKGGGLLGTLVGGPVAGAITGLAGGILVKTGVFNRFLFGDEEKGQKGLIRSIKDGWAKSFKNKDQETMASGTKAIGMVATGTMTGGLLGALAGGPVVGAMAGLALSIKAQAGNFKEWLFGKEDGLQIGDGTTTKRQGVVGRIGNAINANIINPMKTEIVFIAKDFKSTVEHRVLAPFTFLAEDLSDRFGRVASSLTEKVGNMASTIRGTIQTKLDDVMQGVFSNITKITGNVISKSADFIWGGFKKVMSTPGALIEATIKTLDLRDKFKNWKPVKFLTDLGKDIRDLAITGTKKIIKGVFKIVTAPFRLAYNFIKKIGSGIKNLGSSLLDRAKNLRLADRIRNSERFQNFKENFKEARDARMKKRFGDGTASDSLIQRMNRNKEEYKKEQAEIKKQRDDNRRHNNNAKLIQKYSKGQFSEDTEEARTWLKYHNKKAYNKLMKNAGTSITQEEDALREQAEIEKNGASTTGMSEDAVSRANFAHLNEQAKQTQLLVGIKNLINKLFGEDTGEEEYEENEHSRETVSNMSREEKLQELDELGLSHDEDADEQELEDTLVRFYSGGRSHKEGMFSRIKKSISNYFKNDFFKHIRGLDKKKDDKNDNTNGAAFLAEALSNATGEDVESHAEGGFIDSGKTSLVGENGAELVHVSDDGADVLDADETEGAIKGILGKKKKKRKRLSDLFKRKKKRKDENNDVDDALEEQADEQRQNRSTFAAFKLGRAKNLKEQISAMAESNRVSIERLTDMRMDSQEKALKNAKTADELKKEAEEAKYRKAQLANQGATLSAIKDTGNKVSIFKDLWSGIFSKKGLVTGAIILGALWLKKKMPGLFELLEKGLGAVIQFVGGFVKDTVKDIMWTDENQARTDGNSMSEEYHKQVNDIKNGNFLTDANGDVTAQTTARTKALARLGINVAYSGVKLPFASKATRIEKGVANIGKGVFDIGKKGVSKAGSAVANSKLGKKVAEVGGAAKTKVTTAVANSKLGKTVTEAKTKVAEVGGAAKTKVTTAVATKADDMAKVMAEKSANSEGFLSKISGYLEKFFKSVSEKFGKETGEKVSEDAIKGFKPAELIKNLKEAGDKKIAQLYEKITGKTVEGSTAAVISLGTTELIFAGVGALEGIDGTAKLFYVSRKDVDGKMRTISAIFSAFAGTTLGGIIDIILSFIGAIMGTDILHNWALGLYRILVGNDKKKLDKLDKAQSKWKDKYLGERDKKIEKQYETQKKAGIIGEDVTYEMFKAGLEDGTYSASYKSFQNWNAKKNATLIDKGIGAVGKGFKKTKWGVKKGAKKIFGGETYYTDSNGNKYTKNMDGTYQVTSKDGKDLGYINKKALPDDLKKHKSKGALGNIGSSVKKIGKKGAKLVKNAGKKITKGVKKIGKKGAKLVKNAGKKITKGVKKVNKAGATVVKSTKKTVSKGVKKVKGIGSKITKGAKSAVKKTSKKAKSVIKNPIKSVKKVGKKAVKKGKATVSKVKKGAKSALKTIAKALTPVALSDIGEKAVATIAGIFGISMTKNQIKNPIQKQKGSSKKSSIISKGIKTINSDGNDVNPLAVEGDSSSTGSKLIKTKDKVKNLISSIGSSIKNTDNENKGIDSALKSGFEKIKENFNNKNMTLEECMTADVNSTDKDNSMHGIVGAAFNIEKTMLAPMAMMNSVSNDICESFKGKDSSGANIDKTTENFISTLNEYTDPSKSMESFNSEKMSDEDNSPIAKIVSPMIKSVMGIYISVMRSMNTVSNWLSKKLKKLTKKSSSSSKSTVTTAKNFITNSISSLFNLGGNGGGMGVGDETLNGASYFSQNDPRWKDSSYNVGNDNATMAEAGCGPTAMAMAVNTVKNGGTGKNVTPTELAGIAKMTGNRDETGTNWNFINQSANMLGVNSTQKLYPTATDISTQLDTGNPIVLSGYGTNSNSPYTSAGHYVVAVGKDSNGNVIVNDPRGKSYSGSYDLKTLANDTGSSWMISSPNGGHGKIRKALNNRRKKKKKHGGYGDVRKWLTVVQKVKQAIADQKPGYSQSNYITIEIGGVSKKVRTDCSGFVCACMKYYGVLDDSVSLSTGVMLAGSSVMANSGFTHYDWPGWENLEPGDIVVKSGHTEIFAFNQNGKSYVYNNGSDSSVNSPETTYRSYSTYTDVWRPCEPGENCVNTGLGTASSSTVSASSASIDTDNINSGDSGFSGMSSFISSFFSEYSNRAMSGDYNTDYSSLLTSSDDNISTNSSGSTSSDSSVTASSPTLTGNSTKEKIWNFLTSNGFSKNAAAGAMGNWEKESHNDPTLIECNYCTDSTTADNASKSTENLDSFTQNVVFPAYVRSGISINREAYKGNDGHYYPGFGLAQWTGPRGYNLKKFADDNNMDWRDVGTQLQFFKQHPNEISSRGNLVDTMNKAGSPEDAATLFLDGFEMNSPNWHSTAARGPEENSARRANARYIYDTYGGGGGFGEGSNNKTGLSRRQKVRVKYAKKVSKGGYGTSITGNSSSINSLTNYESISKFINTNKDSSIQELFVNAIEILAMIAGNTSDASVKLELLKNSLQAPVRSTETNNNIIVPGNTTGNSNTSRINITTNKNNGKEYTARAIAQGGY